jgi:hypothetical protein
MLPKQFKKTKAKIEEYVKKMTHLHLEHKELNIVDNLTECKKLTNVYL